MQTIHFLSPKLCSFSSYSLISKLGATIFPMAQPGRSTYFLSRWIFLRGVGVIYLIAFLSLGSQISGLVGSHGLFSSSLADAWIQFISFLGILSSASLIL